MIKTLKGKFCKQCKKPSEEWVMRSIDYRRVFCTRDCYLKFRTRYTYPKKRLSSQEWQNYWKLVHARKVPLESILRLMREEYRNNKV